MKSWNQHKIQTDNGETVEAAAPIILSASRATDIPAFYADWFFERLERGYAKWINPFNQKAQYISLADVRAIVFWSKNPRQIMKHLPKLDQRKINYYFQFTLNDYILENLEPAVPSLDKRIETFKELSSLIGKEKVIWRFDPLILTTTMDKNALLRKIQKVGDHIHKFTEKLVFSFADISVYKKVQRNLTNAGIEYKDFTQEDMEEMAQQLQRLNEKHWGLDLSTCSEQINLDQYNISHNKCIDDDLMIRLFDHDRELMQFLGYDPEPQSLLFGEDSADKSGSKKLKDKGQRKACGCIISKDIGMYDTCGHLCTYCYANSSPKTVKSNIQKHSFKHEAIVPKSSAN